MNTWGMNKRATQIILRSFLLILLISPFGATAFSYDRILAFGDSLSDDGANGTTDPFGIKHFTNGEVWVEYLADSSRLNIPLFDMAFGGATTGYDNPAAGSSMYGLNWQVDAYKAYYSSQISSDTLVTVWAGANDFFQGRAYDTAAGNIQSALQKLADAGFKNFLVPNLPDLGYTPAFKGGALQGAATGWSNAFNSYLTADLAALRLANPTVNFYTFDTFGLLHAAIADPGTYGFTNVDDQWTVVGGDPNTFLFWDGVHPMTKAHLMLADNMLAALPAPVPIPAAFLLFGSGLLGLFGIRRKLS